MPPTVLSRLAVRRLLPRFRPCIPSLEVVNRSPNPLLYRQSRHLSSQPTPTLVKSRTPASDDPKGSPKGGVAPVADFVVQEQRKKDWSVVRKMMEHMWPQDWGVRRRVVLGLGLLVGGKVNRVLNSIVFLLTTIRIPSC